MKIDNFRRGNFCMFSHAIDVEREFRVVADWNFNDSRRCFHSPAAVGSPAYSIANSLSQPIKPLARCSAGLRDSDRIEKNCDTRVRGRDFNDARNGSASQLLKCAEDLVQRFLRRILKLVAQAHDQRGISESRNLHARKDRPARREL